MIRVEDLVHRRGETIVLDGISLQIDDGESLAIAGPNGAGKTTLVRHFNGLLEPDSGTVAVDDAGVIGNPLAARTAIGMVFQDPLDCFVAATVGSDVAFGPENLGLPREEVDRRVDDALDAVEMTGARERRIEHLSGGERARVAIAGALAMEPEHLVLDEPFAGLDHPARRSIRERLEALADAGTSIVVVTHDLRDLSPLVDRIVVLSTGEIVLETDAPGDERLAEFGVRPC
jgi:biotin transport system ATP-binding protein